MEGVYECSTETCIQLILTNSVAAFIGLIAFLVAVCSGCMSDDEGEDHGSLKTFERAVEDRETTMVGFGEENANGRACDEQGCWSVYEEGISAFATRAQRDLAIAAQQAKPGGDEPSDTSNASNTNAVLLEIGTRPPDELVELTVALEDHANERMPRLQGLDTAARQFLVQQRKSLFAASQDSLSLSLEVLDAEIIYRRWLTNQVVVRIPAARVQELATLSSVRAVYPNVSDRPIAAVDGLQRKTDVRALDYYSSGHDGGSGSRSGGEIRLGIIESASELNCSHVGWDDWYQGPTRIKHAGVCTSHFCNTPGTLAWSAACTPATGDDHGTTVASIAAGSIEQGQDYLFSGTNTLLQRQRSGIATEAEIFYISAEDSGCQDVVNALDSLVSQGVDVVNMSWVLGGSSSSHFSKSYDPCGFKNNLRAASEAGVILVAGSGNYNEAHAEQTTQLPANNQHVVSVGEVVDSSSSYYSYRGSTWYAGSNAGVFFGSYHGGGTAQFPLVDLVTWGHVSDVFNETGSNSYDYGEHLGTSFAAPTVAGLAGLTRDWMHSLGWTETLGTIQALLLLMGDGYSGSNDPNNYYFSTVTEKTGYGRVRGRVPNSTFGGSNSYMSTRTVTIYDGQDYWWPIVWSFPTRTGYTGLKAVMWFHDSDYVDVPRIDFEIVDRCPSSGTEQIIRKASTYNANKKRIRLRGYEIDGKCLWARIRGVSVPYLGRTVWAATSAYSSDPTLH